MYTGANATLKLATVNIEHKMVATRHPTVEGPRHLQEIALLQTILSKYVIHRQLKGHSHDLSLATCELIREKFNTHSLLQVLCHLDRGRLVGTSILPPLKMLDTEETSPMNVLKSLMRLPVALSQDYSGVYFTPHGANIIRKLGI